MSTDKFGDVALVIRGEAFFKGVNAVALFGFVREGLETIEIVAFKLVLSGVFDHVPLN